MLSRNLYILTGTLLMFSVISYAMAFTGLAHEQGAPADDSLWRTIGIVLLLIALVTALLGVLQHMFEQTDRRTPGGQEAVHRAELARRSALRVGRAAGKPEPAAPSFDITGRGKALAARAARDAREQARRQAEDDSR